MVVTESGLKTCRLCRRSLPLDHFYESRAGVPASRCKGCHGLALLRCRFCRRIFIGKPGRKACSRLCRDLLRPPTFLLCRCCGQLFGPVKHLNRLFCSYGCKVRAQTTGRQTVRRTNRKARNAQSLLRYHVQAGHIVRPSVCEECGATDRSIEGAHYDYDEPLRVRWLCIPCHRRWDKREPKGATYVAASPAGVEGGRA